MKSEEIKSKKTEKPLIAGYFIAFILFILIAFLLMNYFNILSLSRVLPGVFGWLPHMTTGNVVNKDSNKVEKTSQAENASSFTLPIDPENEDVFLMEISYFVSITVDKINRSGDAITLDSTLSRSGQKLNQVKVASDTPVVRGENARPSSMANLKEGMNVNVRLKYDSKTKELIIDHINLGPENPSADSPTPTPPSNPSE